uniref:Nuclease HARBI1 n=1 Tax=Ditylenchus dipsaci TaxID=166011 RepID=A0A915CNI8_9BILA
MDAVALSLLSLYVILKHKKQQAKRKRLCCIRPPHASRCALQYGMEIFERYYRSDDPKDLRSFCRLSPRQFDELLELVEDELMHQLTHVRPLLPRYRLAIFLRHIAHGISYVAFQHEFAIGVKTASDICEEVAKPIIKVLDPIHLPAPKTDEWLRNAQEFNALYGFPHVKNNSKKLSGAGAEECATAVKWAHFESMGFLRDKQHQEERYSNLSQSIMEADDSEVN